MKNSVKLLLAVLGTVLIAAMSCTKEIAQVIEPEHTPEVEVDGGPEKFTCKMRLNGSRVNYDDPLTKSEATDTSWADGSKIYLRMESSIGQTLGDAIYSADDSLWTVNYYGPLTDSVETKCVAIYTEDIVEYESPVFTFNEQSIIYEDPQATYIFIDGELTVTASLKPKTGRIRFAGESATVIKVYGVTHYTSYNIDDNIYSISAEPVKLTVGNDGLTPYLYGYFTETAEPTFKVWVDSTEAYTKFCSKKIFQAGQSGRLSIPTATAHNGWTKGLHFNVNGARFKMVPVEGGSFMMGDTSSTSSSYMTAHKVNLTGSCIAETELTNLLYERLSSPTYNPTYPDKPKNFNYRQYYSSSYADVATTLGKLNTFLNTTFDIPTEAQWEYAARGGQMSKGYKYAGSDNMNDVGWYYSNCSATQNVKQKKANELGLYDMSGNLVEYVKDYYDVYPIAPQTDPCVGPESGQTYMVKRGGDYNDSADYCTNIYRTSSSATGSSSYAGIRLVLNWN